MTYSTIPTAGSGDAIELFWVNKALAISPQTTTISLNDARVRAIAGIPSGAISLNDLYVPATTLVAVSSIGLVGFAYAAFGGINPIQLSSVNIIQVGDSGGSFTFLVDGTVARSFFTSIVINGNTYDTATSTTFVQGGTETTWTWSTPAGLVADTRYTFTIT